MGATSMWVQFYNGNYFLAIALLCVCLGNRCLCQLVSTANSIPYHNRNHSATTVTFLDKTLKMETWRAIQNESLRWSEEGQWVLNSSMRIIDNMTLYAPCLKMRYGKNNFCSWVLDGNVLKYYWEVNGSKIDSLGQRTPIVNMLAPFDAHRFCDMLEDGYG
jgi:hypothetical protein